MPWFELLLKGKTLRNRYLLESPLGHGGMGAVFRARDLQLERPVAVKVVLLPEGPPELHENLRSRFRREARLAAQLRHPHVVRTYDFGTDDEFNLDYLVMELLSGIDLRQYLAQRGPPHPDDARRMLLEAARGIAAGHRARPSSLIHRDVKPANLFLADPDDGDEPHVVVLDFGIALPDNDDHTLTRLTYAAVGPLSRQYAAPEQLDGKHLTPACDVFSLGATAFELFTGKSMATGDTPSAGTERAIRDARAYIAANPARFPPGVAEVLVRSLSLRPEDRFPDASALALALQSLPRVERAAPVVPAAAVPDAPTVTLTPTATLTSAAPEAEARPDGPPPSEPKANPDRPVPEPRLDLHPPALEPEVDLDRPAPDAKANPDRLVSAPKTNPDRPVSAPKANPDRPVSTPKTNPDRPVSTPKTNPDRPVSAPKVNPDRPVSTPKVKAPAPAPEPKVKAPAPAPEPKVKAPAPAPEPKAKPPAPAPKPAPNAGKGKPAATPSTSHADSLIGLLLLLIIGAALWWFTNASRRESAEMVEAADTSVVTTQDTTIPPVDSAAMDTTMAPVVDPAAERRGLAEALATFSPVVLDRVQQLGYRPARLLVHESFDTDQEIEDTPGGQLYAIRGGRARLMTRASGQAAVRLWYVSHKDFVARVGLRYESGEANNGAGLHFRDGVSVRVDGSGSDNYTGYTVENWTGDAWSPVVPWTESGTVRGTGDNVLEVVAVGGSLSLYINGAHVSTTTGILNQIGDQLGIRAGTNGMTYSFDDLVAVSLEVPM